MPRRCARIFTFWYAYSIPELFATAVDNSAVVRPNRCGRLPSPGNARTPRGALQRLDLVEVVSPNRPSDGSGAWSPCNGGGSRRPRVADCPDVDGPDNDFNRECSKRMQAQVIAMCFHLEIQSAICLCAVPSPLTLAVLALKVQI